jgi:hypothetical protein
MAGLCDDRGTSAEEQSQPARDALRGPNAARETRPEVLAVREGAELQEALCRTRDPYAPESTALALAAAAHRTGAGWRDSRSLPPDRKLGYLGFCSTAACGQGCKPSYLSDSLIDDEARRRGQGKCARLIVPHVADDGLLAVGFS